jgi:hypothetical protein
LVFNLLKSRRKKIDLDQVRSLSSKGQKRGEPGISRKTLQGFAVTNVALDQAGPEMPD